jgi:hypothetical protein
MKNNKVAKELIKIAKSLFSSDSFDLNLAKDIGLKLPKGVWQDYDPEQIKMGIEVEFEHFAEINEKTRKLAAIIAANHLDEMPDYYTALKKMESEHGV